MVTVKADFSILTPTEKAQRWDNSDGRAVVFLILVLGEEADCYNSTKRGMFTLKT